MNRPLSLVSSLWQSSCFADQEGFSLVVQVQGRDTKNLTASGCVLFPMGLAVKGGICSVTMHFMLATM